jgi:hypothetical protein
MLYIDAIIGANRKTIAATIIELKKISFKDLM